jgi:hypothetical protein
MTFVRPPAGVWTAICAGCGTRHFVSLGLDGWDVVQTAPEDELLWYALG